MSLRPANARRPARAPVPDNRFILSLAWGHREHKLMLPTPVLYGLGLGLPVIAVVYLAATAYLFFRDDVIAGLMARQAHMQYAYEDRLAALRLQFDQVTSRQMLDQDSFEGKMRDIVSRQAQIETRAAVMASLTERLGAIGRSATTAATSAAASATTAIAKAVKPLLPGAHADPKAKALGSVEAYAPIDNPQPGVPERPQPEDDGLRRSSDDGLPSRAEAAPAPAAAPALTLSEAADPGMPIGLRVQALNSAIDGAERTQVVALRQLEKPALAEAARLDAVIGTTGLPATRLRARPSDRPDAVGGPFIAARPDGKGSPFDAELARTHAAVLKLDQLQRIVPTIPLRKPLDGDLEQTSGFGYRVDPFLGRPALHSGLDFRGEYGSPVRATAAGTIVNAGPTGGYGNMVEIDHGNGLSTRYGHLSGIAVSEGQKVEAGAIVGRLGSTGRSTGNHLHYEVRIDDDAVDPARFIKAATMLAGD
jgi:murein DD-endopeptidase MepM/ murein hydrolase activator NlpD